MSTLPTYEQLLEVPAVLELEVEDAFIDENGHMNIRDYFGQLAWGMWKVAVASGVSDEYIEVRRRSLFTVEHHLRYHGEMRLGTPFSVRVRILDRSERVVHAMGFVVDHARRRLAATMEASWVHVDMDTRASTDLTPELAAAFDALIAESRALGWDAPVSGAMGVRRD